MKVLGAFEIKGRGRVLTFKAEQTIPAVRTYFRRKGDTSVEWLARGLERFCMYLDRPTIEHGEEFGVLVPEGCDLVPGDDVDFTRP